MQNYNKSISMLPIYIIDPLLLFMARLFYGYETHLL